MCGIIGSVCRKESPEHFANAMELLRHRGPDDRSVESFQLTKGYLTLGHQRLSIIDLSENGRQPMSSHDGRFSIVFNGEIYNYKELRADLQAAGLEFKTNSDTEVLIYAWITWGIDCLVKLKGMFAFVIFDKVTESITCARDSFGIKPFYYYYDNNNFYFASEIPALLKIRDSSTELNHQAILDFLLYASYDKDEHTFFDGIKSLPPSCILSVRIESVLSVEIKRWWSPSIEQSSALSFSQASEKLREMFLENVRLHLRSDVPLGATLSGGLDSSSVVCAMRHLEPDVPIHTFTYVAKGSRLNEEKWADCINKHVNAIPHKVSVTNTELVADLDNMIKAQGEPFSTSSIYAQYRVFKAAREAGIVVTLDGQGGDEILAGYEGYPHQRIQSYFDKQQYGMALQFIRDFNKNNEKVPLNEFVEVARNSIPDGIHQYITKQRTLRNIPVWIKQKKIDGLNQTLPGNLGRFYQSQSRKGRRLAALLAEELMQTRIPRLLRYADRNSMFFSIESRVPFLTNDLVGFTLSLPENYLVSEHGDSKHLFKHAVRGLVPDAIIDRKDKIGFETPEFDLVKMLPDSIVTELEGIQSLPYIDIDLLRKHNKKTIASGVYNPQIWRVIVLSRWLELIQ